MTARMLTRFSADLARWPSFWCQVTQFQTWPVINKMLSKIHDDCLKNVTTRVLTRFSAVWPGDLVFGPRWPSFELDLEIIKTNILSKTHDDCLKNVTARVLKFFAVTLIWPGDLVFYPKWPSFKLALELIKIKHFKQDSWWLLQKCDR